MNVIGEASALIAVLEREQQHGGPIRRRMLNEERLKLLVSRDKTRQGRLSEDELLDQIREARRVLAMYPWPL